MFGGLPPGSTRPRPWLSQGGLPQQPSGAVPPQQPSGGMVGIGAHALQAIEQGLLEGADVFVGIQVFNKL